MPLNKGNRCLDRLIRERQSQRFPSLRMYRYIRDRKRVDILSMSAPDFIKPRSLDVCIHRENRVVGLRRAEEQEIGGSAKFVAVLLEEAPCPDVAVAEAGVVERWEARNTAEERAGLRAEGVEEEIVEGGENELVRDVRLRCRA
jgi:hypothetical protein